MGAEAESAFLLAKRSQPSCFNRQHKDMREQRKLLSEVQLT